MYYELVIFVYFLFWDGYLESKYLGWVWWWGGDISEVEEDHEEEGPQGRQRLAGQCRAGLVGAEKIDEKNIDE